MQNRKERRDRRPGTQRQGIVRMGTALRRAGREKERHGGFDWPGARPTLPAPPAFLQECQGQNAHLGSTESSAPQKPITLNFILSLLPHGAECNSKSTLLQFWMLVSKNKTVVIWFLACFANACLKHPV